MDKFCKTLIGVFAVDVTICTIAFYYAVTSGSPIAAVTAIATLIPMPAIMPYVFVDVLGLRIL